AFALVAGLAGAAVGTTAEAATPSSSVPAIPANAGVTWAACPQYSDAVLDYLRIRPTDYDRFRAILARVRCGTVHVPLDYRNPHGPQIAIAFTDLPATDQAHRLGTLAM